MIKLTFCLRRQAHLTRKEFQQHWLEHHGPIVQKHAAALNLRRYAQHHASDDPVNDALRQGRGAQEAYDGVAELWWDSVQAMQDAFTTPEGKAAGRELMEDEKTFIDASRSSLWVGEEHVLVGD